MYTVYMYNIVISVVGVFIVPLPFNHSTVLEPWRPIYRGGTGNASHLDLRQIRVHFCRLHQIGYCGQHQGGQGVGEPPIANVESPMHVSHGHKTHTETHMVSEVLEKNEMNGPFFLGLSEIGPPRTHREV